MISSDDPGASREEILKGNQKKIQKKKDSTENQKKDQYPQDGEKW